MLGYTCKKSTAAELLLPPVQGTREGEAFSNCASPKVSQVGTTQFPHGVKLHKGLHYESHNVIHSLITSGNPTLLLCSKTISCPLLLLPYV